MPQHQKGCDGGHLALGDDAVGDQYGRVGDEALLHAQDDAGIEMAAHADGSLLVVPSQMDSMPIEAASRRLDEAGAPVVGYVVNGAPEYRPPTLMRALRRALIVFLIALFSLLAWNAVKVWDSWRTADRESLDVVAASELLPLPTGGIVDEELDAVVGKLRVVPDPAERCEIAKTAQRLVMENALMLPTLSEPIFYALSDDVVDFQLMSEGQFFFLHNTDIVSTP